ncbi:MAG: hypothetical protein M3416_02735 [Acidobacteriota bacterium]|nr:hypothetical protein [Acidobacteriota bacterium]
MSYSRIITITTLLLLVGCVDTASGQSRGRRQTTPRPTAAAPKVAPAGETSQKEDKYWAAQRSVEAAIQQLEAYLRESPDGERAETARQQLAALRGVTLTVSRPEWVGMRRGIQPRDVPQWRVAAVDSRPDRTRLTVEVACRREDGGYCYFQPFDRFPLVLVDGAGRYYPMLEAGALPPDVSYDEREGRASISGGRVVAVTADFAPLAAGATTGQIYYRDDNQAQPARLSLPRRR